MYAMLENRTHLQEAAMCRRPNYLCTYSMGTNTSCQLPIRRKHLQFNEGGTGLRMRILTLLAAAVALTYTVQPAEAGAIRYLGRQIKGGSQEAANATVGAGETVGKATAGAVSSGANATKEGATAAGGGAAAVGTATGNAAKAGAGAVKDG